LIIHLIDGTYELFRQFYGRRSATGGKDAPLGAATGVLHSVLAMIEAGATHLGVATDHVIESFRNERWPGYKTGDGMDPALWSQFHPLEDALAAMGVAVWPMVELEADDGLASAARIVASDAAVVRVCIWTPDKDLAQCVQGDRVVQMVRRSNRGASPKGTPATEIRTAAGVREKFGVDPAAIPDFLALVGDSADGYPGIAGIGKVGAARLVNRHGRIEDFPAEVLGGQQAMALLFKDLATLRADAPLFSDASALRWSGPSSSFPALAERLGDPTLMRRAAELASRPR
jgi:5'-3' exonuclease